MSLCECGCGETTAVATITKNDRGQKKGQHLRFVNGHNGRKRRVLGEPKRCYRCREVKPDSEFLRDPRKADGLFASCRSCCREIRNGFAARNRQEMVKRTAQWRSENPERCRESKRRAEANRRARKRGAFVEYVDPRIVYERDEATCGICGEHVLWAEYHLDHIVPLARGGTHEYANVQVSHARCNIRKGAG